MNLILTKKQKKIANCLSAIIIVLLALSAWGAYNKKNDIDKFVVDVKKEDILTARYYKDQKENFILYVCEKADSKECDRMVEDVRENMFHLGFNADVHYVNVQDYIDDINDPEHTEESRMEAIQKYVDIMYEMSIESFPQLIAYKNGVAYSILTDMVNPELFLVYTSENDKEQYYEQTKNLTLGWLNMIKDQYKK